MAGREWLRADFVHMITTGFRAAKPLPRLLDCVGVEAELGAANSEHGRHPDN
jgi:hypothetical protein